MPDAAIEEARENVRRCYVMEPGKLYRVTMHSDRTFVIRFHELAEHNDAVVVDCTEQNAEALGGLGSVPRLLLAHLVTNVEVV